MGTHGQEGAYQSLVAFTVSSDLKSLLFATEKNTRKYRNIKEDPKVAFLVDDRLGQKDDFYKTAAVTAVGLAREVKGVQRTKFLKAHIRRHPDLKVFLQGPGCALFRIHVRAYYLVSEFQKVQELVL